MRKRLLFLLALAFPWLRFKFNQASSFTEFGIYPIFRGFSDGSVCKVADILWDALEHYRELQGVLLTLNSLPQSEAHKAMVKRARQDLDDAAHRYRALLRLAKYFRAESFEQMPEVQMSKQVLRAQGKRPMLPMGWAEY